MAVDIKMLRIGSHVEYEGKRVRVALVREDGCICEYKDNGQDVVIGIGIEKNPIPITPDLLKELGFEDCAKRRWHTEDWEKRWGECQYLSFTKLYRGEWRVRYFDGAKDRGQTVVRYLHETEAFLALHGVELIKE